MLDAVKHSAARPLASELMSNPMPGVKPLVPIMQRLFRIQQIHRTYRAVRERVAASWIKPSFKEVPSHVGNDR